MRRSRHNRLRVHKGGRVPEPFIRKYFRVRRMIDRHEFHRVEVIDLFHRLAETDTEESTIWLELGSRDLYPFIRVWNISSLGSDPVPDYCSSNRIGNEFVLFAIPGEQDRTRAAAPVKLCHLQNSLGNRIDFVLRDTRRPEHADDIRLYVLAKTNQKPDRPLTKKAISPANFPFLPQSASKHFHFGP